MPKKKTPARPTKMIHIRLTEAVHRKLKVEAARGGITIQEWVASAIKRQLQEN